MKVARFRNPVVDFAFQGIWETQDRERSLFWCSGHQFEGLRAIFCTYTGEDR
jgi:hypothetical protein